MKFLHTADIHLDSPMESKLPPEKAKERRGELLTSFSRMAEFASESGVAAVIVAGDMFDRKKVGRRAMKFVLDTVARFENTDFLVLPGNHDGFAFGDEELPSNFKLFTEETTFFEYENVRIAAYSDGVSFDPSCVNIAVLHGADGTDFDLARLGGRGIDYLALGHYHSYSSGKLDARGVWCYSGCPEGRGFDECGEKGFVIIDVNENGLSHAFHPFGKRRIVETDVDMTEGDTLAAQERILECALSALDAKDMVRANITGTFELGREKFYGNISEKYKDKFYYFELRDRSVLKIDPEDYVNDVSLKGEFIRTVMEEVSDEAERGRIISYGIKALMGDSIE